MLAELKQCFMEAYDDNQDGKIDIREVYMTCVCVSQLLSEDWQLWHDWFNRNTMSLSLLPYERASFFLYH